MQQRACMVLSRLASEYQKDRRNRRLHNRAVTSVIVGAIKAVVAAMHEHAGSKLVQQSACMALHELTADNAKSQTQAGNEGAIEAVLAAMHEHVGSELVQQRACVALSSLTTGSPSNQTRAGNAGAVEVLIATMRIHVGGFAVPTARSILRSMGVFSKRELGNGRNTEIFEPFGRKGIVVRPLGYGYE